MISAPPTKPVMMPNSAVTARPKASVSRVVTTTRNASSSARGDTDRRRSGGSVSGRRSDHRATATAATIGIQNTTRHGAIAIATAPSAGANTGTMMNVAITWDMVRAMRSPSKESRTMATASDRGAAAPSPHTNRQAMSAVKLGTNAAPSAPTT